MTETGTMNCPHCGRPNQDNWPLDVGGKIVEGGCQDCWEAEADKEWWRQVRAIAQLLEPAPEPERWKK